MMMTRLTRLLLALCLVLPMNALAANGMISVKSNHNVSVTANKLVTALKNKGMTVMSRVNHSANAKTVGLKLRPTELVIFGNPKVGTLLMHCAQSVALDLPQKALIWQDENDQVWLAYNDPEYLKQRHGIKGCDEAVDKVAGALSAFAATATE